MFETCDTAYTEHYTYFRCAMKITKWGTDHISCLPRCCFRSWAFNFSLVTCWQQNWNWICTFLLQIREYKRSLSRISQRQKQKYKFWQVLWAYKITFFNMCLKPVTALLFWSPNTTSMTWNHHLHLSEKNYFQRPSNVQTAPEVP